MGRYRVSIKIILFFYLLLSSILGADEITNIIADLALPNTHQVVVGMQNIKGAGLNYVYAWQQWQKVSQTITIDSLFSMLLI